MKYEINTTLSIGDVIELNDMVEYTDKGLYAVNGVCAYTEQGEFKADTISYLIDNLSNDHRNNELHEDTVISALSNGNIKKRTDIICDKYLVEYFDMYDNVDKTETIYVQNNIMNINEDYIKTRLSVDFHFNENHVEKNNFTIKSFRKV